MSKIGLSDAGGTDQKHVAFLYLSFIIGFFLSFTATAGLLLWEFCKNAFIMVVNGYRKCDLGFILTDNILVKCFLYLTRLRKFFKAEICFFGGFGISFVFINYFVAGSYTKIADKKSVGCRYKKVAVVFGASAKCTAMNGFVIF